MPALEEKVSITIPLSRGVLKQVEELAEQVDSTVEAELGALVEDSLKRRLSLRERLERLSDSYRARLANDGKLSMSGDEVMEELRNVRQQVARELASK